MNERKIKFLRAVRILAPRDALVLQFASRVDAEQLPEYPGAAALQLVAAFERLSPCERGRHGASGAAGWRGRPAACGGAAGLRKAAARPRGNAARWSVSCPGL